MHCQMVAATCGSPG